MMATYLYSHWQKERVIFHHPVIDVHEFLCEKGFYVLTPVENSGDVDGN